MTKISISIFACLISINSFSQTLTTKDTIIYEAGNELFKFHRQTSTGNGLTLLGGALLVIGTSRNSSISGMQIAGGGIAIIGTLMTLSASRHIGNAGGLLMILSGKPIELKHRKKRNK
jgi:hypothetical protein